MPSNVDESKKIKTAALTACTLGTFLVSFMSSSLNVALPSIGNEFLSDAILLGWTTTSYLLASAMFLVPLGKIADMYGRKKNLTYGLLLFTFSSLFCIFSPSIVFLICCRAFQGIGGSMVIVTATAILTSIFPPGERGRALGINTASVYLGLSLGPVLGGILTQHFGWRSIFLAGIPLAALSLFLLFRKMKGEWTEEKREKLDVTGSLFYSTGLVLIIYGLSIMPSMTSLWLIVAGMLVIILFAWWEWRIENPILDIKLFAANRVFTFSNLAALANYSATYAVSFLLSLYLQYVKGLDPQTAGMILVSQPIVMAVFSPLTGRLSDRIDPRILASTGMAIVVAGLIPLIFLEMYTSLTLIVCTLIVLGFGFALFSSPNVNAIMSSVQKNFYGVASAILSTMRLTGQLLSMGIVMSILSTNLGKASIVPENFQNFLAGNKTTFIISAAICFGGIFASLARGKSGHVPDETMINKQER